MARKGEKIIVELIILIIKSLLSLFQWIFTIIISLFIKEDRSLNPKSLNSINRFNDKNLERLIYQCFESVEVIYTSLNHDIIKSRIMVIERNVESIMINKAKINQNIFTKILITTVEKYKQTYYDRTFRDNQVLILEKNKEQRHTVYAECIYNSFVNYVQNQKNEIDKLKTHKGKTNRVIRIKEVQQLYINTLKETSRRAPTYFEIQEKLQNYLIDFN